MIVNEPTNEWYFYLSDERKKIVLSEPQHLREKKKTYSTEFRAKNMKHETWRNMQHET